MRKRSERSIVFFAAIFVFVCLLFSGGSRLVGHEGGSPVPVQAAPLEGVLLCAAPAPLGETGHVSVRPDAPQRVVRTQELGGLLRPVRVCSDANGNVLHACSYMKSVHQAFSLGDGFV